MRISKQELVELRKEWIDPFDDEEIMGDHAVIVRLIDALSQRDQKEDAMREVLGQLNKAVRLDPKMSDKETIRILVAEYNRRAGIAQAALSSLLKS